MDSVARERGWGGGGCCRVKGKRDGDEEGWTERAGKDCDQGGRLAAGLGAGVG